MSQKQDMIHSNAPFLILNLSSYYLNVCIRIIIIILNIGQDISERTMKNQSKYFVQQRQGKNKSFHPSQFIVNTKPIKSPSPDSKPSNIITHTRSPGLQQIKKQITPIKQQPTALKILQKIQFREKLNPNDLTPKNKQNSQQAQGSNKQYFRSKEKQQEGRTIKPQNKPKIQVQSSTHHHHKSYRSQDAPSQFELRFSSRLKENIQSKTGQLDYLRLLKQKEQTIKQLRDLLQLIQKSNSGQLQQDQRVKILQRKLKQYSKQVKVLQIENQCLISVIQNNHVNIPSNKEQILQREIRELRESLYIAQKINEQQLHKYQDRVGMLQIDNKKLEQECDRLLKLLKEKDSADKRQGSIIPSSSLVVKDRERITLSKIREQYNQNLKLAKQNFQNEYRDCFQSFQSIIQKESKRIDFMNHRIQQLQQALRESKQSPPIKKSKQFKQHQEIQSLLFQKYTKYMKELDQQKKVNEKLNMELSIAWKSLRELQIKSFNSSQDMHNESQNEQISELSCRNTLLKNKIKQLEAINASLNKEIQSIKQSKSNQAKTLEQKLQTIVSVYESRIRNQKGLYTQKCNELQKQKKQGYEHQNLIEEKVSIIVETYQKQAEIYKDNLLQKCKIIQNLQEENQLLRLQLQSYINTNQKETETSKQSQNQRVVQSLQFQLRQLKIRIREDDQLITVLQESKKQIEEENQGLRQQINQMKQSILDFNMALNQSKMHLQELSQRVKGTEVLKEQNQKLHSSIQIKKKQIANMSNLLVSSQRQNQQIIKYISELKLNNFGLNNQTLEQELKALKKSIIQVFMKQKEQTGTKTLQNYYTIETLYEQKIDQNTKLHQLLSEQKDELNREKQQKSRLIQKTSNLQKNILIYEQELKERKLLYEKLLKQKSRIQKEILLSKKIKESKSVDQTNANNVQEITIQIDRIMEIEKKRSKNLFSFFEQRQKS